MGERGGLWGTIGRLGGPWGVLGRPLEVSWGPCGVSGEVPGASLGALGIPEGSLQEGW